MFGGSLAGLGIVGCRTLGCAGSQGRVLGVLCLPSSSVSSATSPSELFSLFDPWVSSCCCCERLANEGCHQACILRTRLLQPPLCYTEGHRQLASGYRSFLPQPLRQSVSLSHGDLPVGPPVSASRGLDGIHLPSGCVPPGSCPSRISTVPSVLSRPTDIPVSGSVFWTFDRFASLHACHGPDLLHHASFWLSDPQLPGRLARPQILFPGDHASERLSLVALSGVGGFGEPLQELPHSFPVSGLSGHDSSDESFEGFPNSSTDPESALSCRRVHLLSTATSRVLAVSPRCHVFHVRSGSRSPAPDVLFTASPQRCGSAGIRGSLDLLGRLLPPGSSVVVRCRSSRGRCSPRSDSGWGASLGDDQLSGSWSPIALRFSINHRELLVVLLAVCGFLHLLTNQLVALFSDNTTALSYLCKEGGTRSSSLNSVAQAILRLCEAHAVRLLPQFIPGRLNILADSLSRGSQVLCSEWTLCREVCQELFRRWPSPSTCLRPPSTIDFQFIFLRWWLHCRRGETPCFGLGTICRLTPFPHSTSFLKCSPRSASFAIWR